MTGTWNVTSSCLSLSGDFDVSNMGVGCLIAPVSGTLEVTGTWSATSAGKYTDKTVTKGTLEFSIAPKCLEISGTTTNCKGIGAVLGAFGYESMDCTAADGGGCKCVGVVNQEGWPGMPNVNVASSGNYKAANNEITMDDEAKYSYCVAGNKMTWTPKLEGVPLTGAVEFQKSGGTGTGGAVGGTGGAGGRSSGNGGATATGGKISGGGATGSGGSTGPGGAAGGSTGAGGTTPTEVGERPCDIYAAANTPCVAAYSMVRSLSKSYSGPLYQVRKDSSAKNQGTGGSTTDIGMTKDGYADVETQDAFCGSTYCTVSILYDQSGNKNDIRRAPKGRTDGGATGAEDDYESIATKGAVTAGGHRVYSLYMNVHDGYRTAVGVKGKNMPLGTAAQSIYELADGTHSGAPCCWDFGNVTTDPTKYGVMNTLFFGIAYWGNGAGSGPWFMADFEAGVWAGGSKVGDPGWGALNDAHPSNPNNPSLKVPFAFGILKTDPSKYALRMADLQTANDVTTAFEGALPKKMDNLGGIVLGVGGDNSNNSYGTFYEGAIVSGYTTTATDLAIMKNIKAVGYAK